MTHYTVFVCDHCGFETRNQDEMLEHEAAHFGLTASEYEGYNHQKQLRKIMYDKLLDGCKIPNDLEQRFKRLDIEIKNFEDTHGIERSMCG